MFINEPNSENRKEAQIKTDKMIEDKLGYSNIITKLWPGLQYYFRSGF